jgi:hypothetical protein
VDSKEIETLVNELETRVDRLRALYEQYFMGIEKIAPAVPQKDVERRIQTLRKEQIRNTAVRFRFQMIIQRYNTYQTHWQRICRQIEEGTYKRDMLRAQRRFKPAAAPDPEPAPEAAPAPEPTPAPEDGPAAGPQLLELDPLEDFSEVDRILDPGSPVAAPKPAPAPVRWRKVEAKAPAPAAAPNPAAPAAAPRPAPHKPPPLPKKPPPLPPAAKARPQGDLSDDRLRQLYAQYVQARRSRNESTAAITYDAMAKSLRESSAKLREKHGKSIDFEVAVKDGKTILRPVVKSSAKS